MDDLGGVGMIAIIPGIVSQGGKDPTLVYQLPQETTFNGTSTYIDTGVKLFDTQKDFTLFVDFTDTTTRANNMTVLHCMYEGTLNGISWPGLVFDFFSQVTTVNNYRFASGMDPYDYSPAWVKTGGRRRKVCAVFQAAAFDRMAWSDNGGAVSTDYTTRSKTAYSYVSISQTVYLGCYRTTSGSQGRFFNGTMHDCKIWERALSDAEIAKLF